MPTTQSGKDESLPHSPRKHRIRDGDTPKRIAKRYLGHEDRWPEIVALNRDVLPNPDILPVGKELRIPDPASSSTANQRDHPVADHEALEKPLTPLVPIP